MYLMWLIVPVLFIQELALTEATLILVYHSGFNLWIVHAIWLAATVIDIAFGFYIGKYLRNRSIGSGWFSATIGRWSEKFKEYVGHRGKALALMLLGLFLFPYIAAFLAAWFDINIVQTTVFVSLGNLIWYLLSWNGPGHRFPDPQHKMGPGAGRPGDHSGGRGFALDREEGYH